MIAGDAADAEEAAQDAFVKAHRALGRFHLPGGPPQAAGRTLLWQHPRLTLRLEAAVGRERALAIARSVR